MKSKKTPAEKGELSSPQSGDEEKLMEQIRGSATREKESIAKRLEVEGKWQPLIDRASEVGHFKQSPGASGTFEEEWAPKWLELATLYTKVTGKDRPDEIEGLPTDGGYQVARLALLKAFEEPTAFPKYFVELFGSLRELSADGGSLDFRMPLRTILSPHLKGQIEAMRDRELQGGAVGEKEDLGVPTRDAVLSAKKCLEQLVGDVGVTVEDLITMLGLTIERPKFLDRSRYFRRRGDNKRPWRLVLSNTRSRARLNGEFEAPQHSWPAPKVLLLVDHLLSKGRLRGDRPGMF